MKMDMLPLATLLVPHTRLLHRNCRWFSICDFLCQANIGDHGYIPHDANVRGDDGRLDRCRAAREVEVILVEIEPIDQISHRLGFKARQAVAAELFVSVPIPTGDRDQEPLGQIKNRIPISRCGHRGGFPIYFDVIVCVNTCGRPSVNNSPSNRMPAIDIIISNRQRFPKRSIGHLARFQSFIQF